MALGGGTFTAQNKILPGTYVNFISLASASAALSDRGIGTIPLPMDWGPEGKVFTVELGDFLKNSLRIFGYPYTAPELRPMREIFKHAIKVHFFRLNSGGAKAQNELATARYSGKRGNDVRIVVEASEGSTEEAPLYDVSTYLDTTKVDHQEEVAAITELMDNEFVSWNKEGALKLTASMPLAGGETGEPEDSAYQAYLDQMESYSYNTMGRLSTDEVIKGLFAAYNRRMRDEVGKKCQVALFNFLADQEGVISVKNGLADAPDSPDLVPWVVGVAAGTAANKSASNMKYDGEYSPYTDFTQAQLEDGIKEGSWMFHLVDEEVTVLSDINTFVSVTDEKSGDFSSNQTVRVLDQIANDIAVIFGSKYNGKVPNDAAGRLSLWRDITKHHEQLQQIRAIEEFSPKDVTVEKKGDTKKAVVVNDHVTPVNAMEQLYMTVLVQ